MKKKQRSTASAATTAASAIPSPTRTSTADLKALIQVHRVFFDKLVELIPAKFYLPPADDDSDHPKPYFHGLSRAAKASLKRQSRENLKLARRNRLDPEKVSQSSTLDLLKQSLGNTGGITEVGPSDHGAEDADVPRSINLGDQKSVTYEELREKLRKKIELLRGNRGEKSKDSNRKKNNKTKKIGSGNDGEKKRKRESDENSGQDVKSGKNEDGEIIEYGMVRMAEEEVEGKRERRKKSKISKAKELERAKRLKEVKRENPRIAEREWWKTATNRAMGLKVHDDPKLLRESMKKEKKRKEKNAEKWKQRMENQGKAKEERQQKRKDNIAERIREKKMRKIAKREKKLLRPGFEGRKEGHITED